MSFLFSSDIAYDVKNWHGRGALWGGYNVCVLAAVDVARFGNWALGKRQCDIPVGMACSGALLFQILALSESSSVSTGWGHVHDFWSVASPFWVYSEHSIYNQHSFVVLLRIDVFPCTRKEKFHAVVATKVLISSASSCWMTAGSSSKDAGLRQRYEACWELYETTWESDVTGLLLVDLPTLCGSPSIVHREHSTHDQDLLRSHGQKDCLRC
jgi:hypothetical protein